MLTPQEQQTQNAYAILADIHNQRHADVDIWQAEYEQLCQHCPGGTVLDLGCGGGRDALLIRSHRYIGLDLSQPMLAEARRLAPQAQFLCADLYSLPLPDASVQAVWAVTSLLHIPYERIGPALSEIYRILTPGGTLFSVMRRGTGEHLLPGRKPGAERYFWYWEPEHWLANLTAANFLTSTWHERTLHGYPWIAAFAFKPH